MRRILLVLCAFLVSGTAHAQTDSIPLRYGDTLAGTITEPIPCQYYRFEGTQGDPITLDMKRTAGSLDGVLALYWRADLTLAPLATNDDRPGGGLDPLIAFTLPETTWYTVAACRLQADRMRVTTGDYTLALIGPASDAGPAAASAPPSLSNTIFGGSAAATLTPAAADNASLITPGSRIESALAADVASVSYQVSAAAGDSVLIVWQRTAGDLAPRLTVTDAHGRVLALVATPDTVSELTLMVLAPEDGLLLITVARYDAARHDAALDGSAGTFTLVVDRAVEPGP